MDAKNSDDEMTKARKHGVKALKAQSTEPTQVDTASISLWSKLWASVFSPWKSWCDSRAEIARLSEELKGVREELRLLQRQRDNTNGDVARQGHALLEKLKALNTTNTALHSEPKTEEKHTAAPVVQISRPPLPFNPSDLMVNLSYTTVRQP